MEFHAQFDSFRAAVLNRAHYTEVAGFRTWQPIQQVDDLNAYLDRLAMEYCNVDSETRGRIRALFADPDALGYLHRYIEQIPARLREHESSEMLQLGLAAISITDMRPDFRDTLYELGYLFKAACEARINQPLDYLKKIAVLSNQTRNPSTAKIIAEFDQCAVFRGGGF